MKLSIIIVTWNNAGTIEDCLESLKQINIEKEILVVDNNSRDRTTELVKVHPKINLIENSENKGYGRACNQGVKKVIGEFLLFLNPDTIVHQGAVEKMVTFLENNPSATAVCPKLLGEKGNTLNEVAEFPNLTNQIILELKLQKLTFLKNFVYKKFDYSKTAEVDHLMGAATLMRRSEFVNLGGFDENFFLWFEDTDLLKRIREKKGKTFYLAEAVVTHLGSRSTRQISYLEKQLIWNKSLIYYFKKHKGWFKLLLIVPFVLLSFIPALALSLRRN